MLQPKHTRRAVAPVIATILLVAIAVVGATLIFVFSQGVFNEQQLAAPAALDQISILGYDARDTAARLYHNGTSSSDITAVTNIGNGILETGDTVVVYVENAGSQDVDIVEVKFAGNTYTFSATADTQGSYSIFGSEIQSTQVLAPGEIASITIDLSEPIKIGRSGLVQITTGTGEFSDRVQIGRQTG